MKNKMSFILVMFFMLLTASKAHAYRYPLPEVCRYVPSASVQDKFIAVSCLVSVGIAAAVSYDQAINGFPGFYPATLDTASNGFCSDINPCFTQIGPRSFYQPQQPPFGTFGLWDSDWEKISNTTYRYHPLSIDCQYNNQSGSFQCNCPAPSTWNVNSLTCQ